MTKLEKIKVFVRAGFAVHEGTPDGGYIVKCYPFQPRKREGDAASPGESGEQWLITFEPTKWCIGLTWADGKTLNGKRFYINGKEILDDPEPESVLLNGGDDLTGGGSEGEW